MPSSSSLPIRWPRRSFRAGWPSCEKKSGCAICLRSRRGAARTPYRATAPEGNPPYSRYLAKLALAARLGGVRGEYAAGAWTVVCIGHLWELVPPAFAVGEGNDKQSPTEIADRSPCRKFL